MDEDGFYYGVPILIWVVYFAFIAVELMYNYIKGRWGKKKGEEYAAALGPPRDSRDDS